MFGPIDWGAMFHLETPLLEIFLRGTLMYFALFIMLRCILKRQSGGIGISDILVIVLIADASQNAMAADYRSIPDGVLLVLTIIFWNYTLNWLAFHVPAVRRMIDPPPLPLIKDGSMLRANMRRELITTDELMSQLREQGVDAVEKVKQACMESDGKLSVVTYETVKRTPSQKRANQKKKTSA